MIRVKIVPNDINTVAKVIILDSEDRVLFLKRSKYVDKYAGEWDLPGGHLKENESLEAGLKRETLEETGIDLGDCVFYNNLENLNFFYFKYDSQPVTLSHEHTDYRFFEKSQLKPSEKFQRIALEIIQKVKDES